MLILAPFYAFFQDCTRWTCGYASCMSWYEGSHLGEISLRSILPRPGHAGNRKMFSFGFCCLVFPFSALVKPFLLNNASVQLTAKNATDCGRELETTFCTRPCWPSCWCRRPSRSSQDHNRFPDPLNSRPSGRWWQSRACNREVSSHLYSLYFMLNENCTLMSDAFAGIFPFLPYSRDL